MTIKLVMMCFQANRYKCHYSPFPLNQTDVKLNWNQMQACCFKNMFQAENFRLKYDGS